METRTAWKYQQKKDMTSNCGFELLPFSNPTNLYSPDLALSNYFLFPKLKYHLRGRHFENNDEVIRAIEEFFEERDANFFRDGIAVLEHCWTKWNDVKMGRWWLYLKIVNNCLISLTPSESGLELFERSSNVRNFLSSVITSKIIHVLSLSLSPSLTPSFTLRLSLSFFHNDSLSLSISFSLSLSLFHSVCVSLSLCVSVSLFLPLSLSLCFSLCISFSLSLSLFHSLCVSLFLSVCVSLPFSLSLSLCVSLSLFHSVCVSLPFSLSLSFTLRLSLSLCMCLCFSLSLSLSLSCYFTFFFFFGVTVYISCIALYSSLTSFQFLISPNFFPFFKEYLKPYICVKTNDYNWIRVIT